MNEINLNSGDHILNTTLMLKVLSKLAPQQGWTADWLQVNVRNKPDGRRIIGKYTIEYQGQPGGSGTQHIWRICTNDVREKVRLDDAVKVVKSRTPGLIPLQSAQYQSCESTDEPFNWNGLKLRSIAEQKIAEELEKRHILFFVNARCRITSRIGMTETKEADFLIYYQGNSRILEVDGREYHPSAAEDHQRDRLFERYGIRCTRFTAKECLHDAENVIDEFLELFDVTKFISEFPQNIEQKGRSEEKAMTIDINVDQPPAIHKTSSNSSHNFKLTPKK